ncbi:MAG: tetratricopeptide repeat protein [Thermoanaerobaculia bacterium]
MEFERLEITPLPLIVGQIVRERRTGTLTVIRQPARVVSHWAGGELVLVIPSQHEESLGQFLVARGNIGAHDAQRLDSGDPETIVPRLTELGIMDRSLEQPSLREWMSAVMEPLFSLADGTAVFNDGPAPAPKQRIFLPSTPAFILQSIRSISNGLVLRRSLGDLKKPLAPAKAPPIAPDVLPFTESERKLIAALEEPETAESLLRRFPKDPGAAKILVALLAFGIFVVLEPKFQQPVDIDADAMQRDLALLASIGADDKRSLRAISFARQIPRLDYYEMLDVPRAATRTQVVQQAERLKAIFDPADYPPILREHLDEINRRLDEAFATLTDPIRRQGYDHMLVSSRLTDESRNMDQRLAQRSLSEKNFEKAKSLASDGDYYGAIVLLKQVVRFLPDHAQAWYLLGSCQERNPNWHREAVESYQKALTIDPNDTDVLISLGDLYRHQGLVVRAEACYDDVLKIDADNPQAKSRLQELKGKMKKK